MAEYEPLTFLPYALVEAGYQSPGYQQLFDAALEGWIPAKLRLAGRFRSLAR